MRRLIAIVMRWAAKLSGTIWLAGGRMEDPPSPGRFKLL
jgi:hypothetical protein